MDNAEEINDESDKDVNLSGSGSSGYFMRSKRRKLDKNEDECVADCKTVERRRKTPILYMPVEVLQAIFKYIPHHELSQNVRLVNNRFKIIAEDVLNCSFRYLDKRLNHLILMTDLSLSYTQDDMEMKCIVKLLNMLEILNLQYSIIVSTIWRYVYNSFYKTTKKCMYAGRLIDEYFNFIDNFLHCPNILYSPAVVKDYALPTVVSSIMQLTKQFCIHFDKISEETMPDCLVCSGCKILDLVDCAKYTQKHVTSEIHSSNYFIAEYTYYFRNSWFIAIPVQTSKDMDWNQKQRMMHMRLRRLVLAHNDMFLQLDQYQREVSLRPDPAVGRTKRPGNNVYTGYGDIGDTFFYYGVMNDGAYLQKFQQGINEEEVELREPHEDNPFQAGHLGFKMHVDVRCPLSYAPWNFLKGLSDDELEKLVKKRKTSGPVQIKVTFECEGAARARLPTRYQYYFNPKDL
ncbi:unnamed protein product [Phyllotreta striolata]|uniref:F-box domain-containing protein n=1 Tax=Phyllotreta striolata TaxID=444603 RepID=A0A9N9TX27_PHYSR|nr:unnamed protein product [Phyllotreta striolata]